MNFFAVCSEVRYCEWPFTPFPFYVQWVRIWTINAVVLSKAVNGFVLSTMFFWPQQPSVFFPLCVSHFFFRVMWTSGMQFLSFCCNLYLTSKILKLFCLHILSVGLLVSFHQWIQLKKKISVALLTYSFVISVDIKHNINMKPVKDRAQSWQFHVPLQLLPLRPPF